MRNARSPALLWLLLPASAIADEATPPAPLAGYSDKNFFLRDPNDLFVLVPKGRVNVDWYTFLNRPDESSLAAGVVPNSAADPRASLRNGVFIRRARVGFVGTIGHVIDYKLEGEFASVATNGQYATVVDAAAILNLVDWLQLEAGQFYVPFTLENQTSENFTDFMEKAAVVRFGAPSPRDAGAQLLGEAPKKLARYWLGVFNGDGQDFRNLDNKPAVIGRLVVQPLGPWSKATPWLENLWLGGSFWWQESTNLGGAAAASTTSATQGDLAPLTTQGGFGVFSGNYGNGSDTTSAKNPIRSHLAPDGTTVKYAFELNVPITARYGLRAEYVHQSIDVRRYDDVGSTRNFGAPGNLSGWGAYVEAYAWIGGPVNADYPGRYAVPHWRGYQPAPLAARWAVQLAARYEHVAFEVTGLADTLSGGRDKALGHYGLDVFEFGANLWFTRHARLMVNYLMNFVGAGDGIAENQTKNLFFKDAEHELLFRAQVNL